MNLNIHDAFEVRVEEAAQYFPSDRETPSDAELKTHFSRLGYPMTRAHQIRALHPNRTAVRPLDGVDLLGPAHPLVLDARREVYSLRDELRETALIQESATLATSVRRAIKEHEERKGEIERLLSDETGPLSVKEMDELLPGRDVHRDKRALTTYDGTTYARDEGGPMEQPTWCTEAARALVRDLARRKLHSTARKMEDKPQKRAIEQHVDRIGVEEVMEQSEHFNLGPLDVDGKSTTPERKKRTPSSVLR